MAQLTSDIVWLVEQTITLGDGSTTTALVPQVFLRVQPGDLNDNGALLAGANVDLKLRGDFVNQGDVAGRKLVSIDAGNIRNLAGANISGEQVGLQARQDIEIIGSKVTATDALSVKAGGNVAVASTTRSWENGGSHAQSSISIDRVAGLHVTSPSGIGALTVNAGGDVTLTGANVGIADLRTGQLSAMQEVWGRGQRWRLTQLWFKQQYFDGVLDVKLGRFGEGEDFNSLPCDFQNLVGCGSQVGNWAGGIWYNWPVSQWAARVKFNVTPELALQVGAYEQNPLLLDERRGFTFSTRGGQGPCCR